MPVAEPPLPLALRPFVAARAAYDVEMGGPGLHRGLPSTALTLVLPLGEPLRVRWPDGSADHTAWTSVAGLHAGPAEIVHGGHQSGLQLALTVDGARRLLGVPAAALCGVLTDLTEAVPTLAALPERLCDAATWAERVSLVDYALLAALGRAPARGPRPEVGHALAALTRGVPVSAVADDVGYSRRRLGTLVRDECGLTPKTFQRVARFEGSRRVLGRVGGRSTLADVAARCGYADASHLTRDWVDLAGCPPSVWLREEFPFVQDDGGTGAAVSDP